MSTHLVRTFRFALRLNESGQRAMARELDRQRALYNASHQERRDAWRWACGQAAPLGLVRPDRTALAAIDPGTLDPRRCAGWARLRRHVSPRRGGEVDGEALEISVVEDADQSFPLEIVVDDLGRLRQDA